MNRGVERILTLTFGEGGTEGNYLGNGWSGDEPNQRWMVGQNSEIWLDHAGADHDLVLELDFGVIVKPPELVVQRLLVGVRGTGIAHVMAGRGGTLGFHLPARLVAAPGPIRLLFVHPDFRRPMDLFGDTDDRPLSFLVSALRLSRILPRAIEAGATPLGTEALAAKFESLGDNCEFGLVQRAMGAEPLGLLRFSWIEITNLLRGLRTGFSGLGDPGTVEIVVDGKDQEYLVKENVYGMSYHTFQYEHQLSIETARIQQDTRLRFLKRKLLEDAANGEKIFVIKRVEPLRPEEVLPIYAALNELGPNWLLWVLPADPTHPSGMVEVLLPGLMRGYVDRFAPYNNAPDISLPAWTELCAAAWKAVGRSMRG